MAHPPVWFDCFFSWHIHSNSAKCANKFQIASLLWALYLTPIGKQELCRMKQLKLRFIWCEMLRLGLESSVNASVCPCSSVLPKHFAGQAAGCPPQAPGAAVHADGSHPRLAGPARSAPVSIQEKPIYQVLVKKNKTQDQSAERQYNTTPQHDYYI